VTRFPLHAMLADASALQTGLDDSRDVSMRMECNRKRKPHIAVLVCCMGLAVDCYDFGVVNVIKRNMKQVYGPMSATQDATLSVSSMLGALVGMIFFGVLGDRCGRRKGFIICALLTCTGATLSACAWDPVPGQGNIYWLLTFFRLIMGFGIGGEYPTSASHTAESSSAKGSARNLAFVAASLIVGDVLAPLVVLFCMFAGFSDQATWRFAFGFGAAISLLNTILRICLIQDSDKFQREQKNAQSFGRTLKLLQKYWCPLLGTCGAWFLYDVVDYGLGLFSAEIVGESTGATAFQEVSSVLFYALIGVPGVVLSVYIVPCIGRKQAYIAGTFGMFLVFLVLALLFQELRRNRWLFNVVYGLQLFFDYSCPAAATFLIPAEIFPTAVRATAVGLSAAAGKLGAVVGIYVIGLLKASIGVQLMFGVIALICTIAMAFGYVFLPLYNDRTLHMLELVERHGSQAELYEWLYGGGRAGKGLPESCLLPNAAEAEMHARPANERGRVQP